MNRIITVGREFGSGGRELAKRLADRLQIAYYDHEILLEISKKTSLAEEYVRQVVEHKPSIRYPITIGHTLHRCKYDGCNHSYNDDYTDILPHTFEYTVVKEPTCTEAGFKTGICTEGCNVTDDVEIPATGHSFDKWYVAVEATHFYDGYEERVCLHCQYKETKLIAKLTDDPNAGKQEPKSDFEKAILYITDANHPAIIAVSLFAVIIAIVCIAYIIIKIRITR